MIKITMRQRKVRKDSILHGLPSGQRAMVDKWLFDKGMTYQAVAEGCGRMFGVRVSKSSVGRYYDRQVLQRTAKVSEGVGKRVREEVSECVSGWAREMCVGMLEGRGAADTEEAYQQTLARMTSWALEELKWVAVEEGDLKGVLRVMRILIEARREGNERAMVELRREKFQMLAAGKCLRNLQEVSSLKFSVSRGSGSGGKKRRDTDDARARRHCRETWYLGV